MSWPFLLAKRSGILVREFAIGMGPKIFAHTGKDGTVYTIRILPFGWLCPYGWLGWRYNWDLKQVAPASLTIGSDGKVSDVSTFRIARLDQTALPMNVTAYDFEDKLTITGLVLDETKTYEVDHDATIVEEGMVQNFVSLLRMFNIKMLAFGDVYLPTLLDLWITSFLGCFVPIILAFVQGGVQDTSTNRIQVADGGAAQVAGLKMVMPSRLSIKTRLRIGKLEGIIDRDYSKNSPKVTTFLWRLREVTVRKKRSLLNLRIIKVATF